MIIAVDFDGILCEDDFPNIGKPNYKVISLVRQLIDNEVEVILWTCRCEKELRAAVDWCSDYGLHFCAINDNAPNNKEQYKGVYENPPRKIYADVYVDDHSAEFNYVEKTQNHKQALRNVEVMLERLVQINDKR